VCVRACEHASVLDCPDVGCVCDSGSVKSVRLFELLFSIILSHSLIKLSSEKVTGHSLRDRVSICRRRKGIVLHRSSTRPESQYPTCPLSIPPSALPRYKGVPRL